MLLTAEQLQQIRQIILDYHNAFAVSQYGPHAVAPEILQALKDKGLADVDIETLKDAYVYGRIVALLGESAAAKMSYPKFVAYVKKNPQPLSEAEQHAVTVATQQAGALCQGLGNKLDKATGQILIEADAELRRKLQGTIRDTVAQSLAKRQSIKQLKSDLGHATKDWTRDLNRIAVTETQMANQAGHAAAIAEQNGPDALVAKRVAKNCCDICVSIYTGADGAPRIFKLSALQANGTNFGRKAADTRPVVGPAHPNCLPPGSIITTRLGTRSIENIYPGDIVLTHKQRMRRVTHVWCQPYDGELVYLKSGWVTLRLTPNHMLYDGAQWVPAGEISAGDYVQRDLSVPTCEVNGQAEADYEDFAHILYGQGPKEPFVALVLRYAVFLHEGFIYDRENIAKGPCVPSLHGRLRYLRGGAYSICGGDSLILNQTQWVDDSCQPLVFSRATPQMTHELRRRCCPGPFARLGENGSQAVAADLEFASDSQKAQAFVKMHPQDGLCVERAVAGESRDARLYSRAAGGGQSATDQVATVSEHCGNAAYRHAPVVKQSGNRLRVHVKPVGAASDDARQAQRRAHSSGSNAQDTGYVVQGLVVVEMHSQDGVYIDLGGRGQGGPAGVVHGLDVPLRMQVSKVVRRRYRGMVYNLTVEEDESYLADSFAAHNCRCQLVSVPKGAGFNDKGQLSMTGKRGILTDPQTLEAEMAHKSMLIKAMQQDVNEVSAFGLPIDVTHWADASQQGRWMASGKLPHPALQLNTLIGDDGTAGEVYVVHGKGGPDVAAMGYTRPLDAALGYQARFPQATIESMDVIGLQQFQEYLYKKERDAIHADRTTGITERLVLSQNPAVDDAIKFRPNLPKKRKDIGGITEAFKNPDVFDASTPLRFDKDAYDIYRNTPLLPARKLDIETAVIPPKDLKLIIRRNKKRIADLQENNEKAAEIVEVGAKNAAAFYGLGEHNDANIAPSGDEQLAEIAGTSRKALSKKKRRPVK